MEILGYVVSFVAALGGICLGTVLNYFVLKRLFRQQSKSIMDDLIARLDALAKSKEAEQFREILATVSEWLKSEDAKEIAEEIKRILRSL